MSASSEVPPSEVLRRAEEYWLARESLEEAMRRGFVELTGARLHLRSSTAPFNPTTWPVSKQAHAKVIDNNRVQIDDNDTNGWLRSWLGGTRPSANALAAQQCFRDALTQALKIAELQQSLNLKQSIN